MQKLYFKRISQIGYQQIFLLSNSYIMQTRHFLNLCYVHKFTKFNDNFYEDKKYCRK